MQNFPILKENQVVLLRADIYSGIVLDINFNIAINDKQEAYTIYESFEAAMKNVDSILDERKDVEFCIYDANENLLKFITPVEN